MKKSNRQGFRDDWFELTGNLLQLGTCYSGIRFHSSGIITPYANLLCMSLV